MSAFNGKHHVGIDTYGYILDRGQKAVYAYQKKRAPQWVNRTGSGDSTYRDSTFWQYWAQINWRNGCKQEKFGDGGKFWKSNGIATSQTEQASLAKALVSAGLVESGAKINCMAAWRGSQSWWNGNYAYRQQLSITAGATAIPVGYPIKVSVDSAALETATKVRSDRKDWRIIYWNGTVWADLTRDYVSTINTVFGLQSVISVGASDSNYYLYYGYSGETTSKQPTDDATWNSVYAMYGKTFDSNTLGVWHFNEGTGSSIADQDGSADMSSTNMSWSTGGYFGRAGDFSNSSARTVYQDSTDIFNLGSPTVEAFVKTGSSVTGVYNIIRRDDTHRTYNLLIVNGTLKFNVADVGSSGEVSSISSLSANTSYHVAGTYDGATVKIYINGILDNSLSFTGGIQSETNQKLNIGGRENGTESFGGLISNVRISNTARTSFPYATVGVLSASAGTETTTQPPASNFTLFAGTDTGHIYSWDGTTTWTLSKDCNILAEDGTTTDTTYRVGDTSGTELKVGQCFKVATATNIKEIKLFLKATASAPSGDITVRIETENTSKPSGTLVNSDATGTIANFTGTTNAWKTCTLTTAVPLAAATNYWIVVSAAAQSNDVGWDVAANTANPYADGDVATYTPTTWTVQTGKDAIFAVNSTSTSVNTMLVSSIGGSQQLVAGLGNPTSQINGDARLVTYSGSAWAMSKQFATATESQVLSLAEYSAKMYAGVGPQARIYETSDFATWTLSKDIDFPQKPGYPYVIKEYNSQLIASGGSPEFMVGSYYNGFSFVYNGTIWQSLYPFDHTVVKSSEFYDSFLFIGTYHGQIYTYNTSFLDPLFSFKDDYDWNVVVSTMKYFDDKLFLGLRTQDGITETNTGLWLFDRHGMTQLSSIANNAGVYSMEQVNNILVLGTSDGYVYRQDPTVYQPTGFIQTSYFDANLPTVPKLWNSIIINYDPLLAGHSIAAAYRYKETDAWTSLTPSVAQAVGGTSTTWTFPAGTNSKKISVLITLNTTDTATTPIMREFILQYCLFPIVKWQWNIRIKTKSPLKLADDTIDTRTAEQMRTELEGLLSDTRLHTFTDIDGSTHTVLFYDLDETSWVINQDDTSGSSTPITLIEV
jgi:hypothetical protein